MTELVPESYVAQLDLIAVFGRAAPLHVDLGCGDGSFLCELAQRIPEKNFLGIDKLAGRVAKTCRKASTLDNVRVLNVEIAYAVRYLLPTDLVEKFYLFFPDPWPKRRHHRRRLVTEDFLDSIHRALVNGGLFHIATDLLDYFHQIERVAVGDSRFQKIDIEDEAQLPATKFERRFRVQGLPIYRLSLRKISPVR
ncbi:MAG TPA: tRNA (guanosine(46)-N7)-methyltransferase TrmB [Chthoniobacterales bacterium]|nr:tRNA (guanosine(46)-N7)-methyltransferase TrmB [Chthoniobacterales bacterium]